MEYENFDLWLHPQGDGYLASAQGPAGEGKAFLGRVPIQELDHLFEELLPEGLRVRDLRAARKAGIKQVGERLYELVFTGGVKDCFRNSLEQVGKKGLRLRLRLPPDLCSLPWEYLRNSGEFFALSSSTSLVRYLEASKPGRPLGVRLPLRVLVVMARPTGAAPLNAAQEWSNLKDALGARCNIRIERLETPTLGSLRERLQSKPYHVLHFIGHGQFDREQEDGLILFERDDGGKDPVLGDKLGALLQGHHSLRLVVLNACEGARNSSDDPFGGVAQSLMRTGMPAVIAMQRPVTDGAAIAFSSTFYRWLARTGQVDVAVSQARNEMLARGFDLEWGTPVLHMRSPDGRLFNPSLGPCLIGSAVAAGLAGVGLAWWSFFSGEPVQRPTTTPTPPPPVVETSLPPQPSDSRCPSPPGLDINFAYIPAGSLQVDEKDLNVGKPFCIGRFEVTQKQWAAVTGKAPARQEDEQLPVGKVSINDIPGFLKTLEERDPGGGYRLPQETEWEYAARAGNKGRYSFGDDSEALYLHGNCRSSKVSDGYEKRAPVGQFQPNGFGVSDMHGNVWEWVEEGILRGGSFDSQPKKCTSAERSDERDTIREEDGLRVVRSPINP